MRFFKLFSLLLLLILLPVLALASETPWGRVKVVSIGDAPMKATKMWAPQAVMPGLDHSDDLYLEYRYCRLNSSNRVWQMRLVNKNGKQVNYSGEIDVILPYPSKWSQKNEEYWKWTKSYAERFNWAYSFGYSAFAYDSSNQAVGYYVPAKYYRNIISGYEYNASNELVPIYSDRENLDLFDPAILGYNEYSNLFKIEAYLEERNIAVNNLKIAKVDSHYAHTYEWAYKGFIPIKPNDEYGHRITMWSYAGYLPSVLMQVYDNKPSFDTFKMVYVLAKVTDWRDIWKLLLVEKYDGFKVDNRSEAEKHKIDFQTFLSYKEHCIYHHRYLERQFPYENPHSLYSNGTLIEY